MTTVSSDCIEGCIEACRRCLALIDGVGEDDYRRAVGDQASLGAHLRHCAEHFGCFLQGLEHGLIDYDARERDVSLERDPQRGRAVFERIVEGLTALHRTALRQPVRVRQTASRGRERTVVESSINRELVFLSGHTIHHLAIMVLIARALGIAVAADSGIAYSTAAYREARSHD